MIFDSLTFAGLITIILVLILVFGSIYYSHIISKRNLKILARNAIMVEADEEMKALCKKIITIDPNSCPLLDGSAISLIKADPDKLKNILKEHLKKLEAGV